MSKLLAEQVVDAHEKIERARQMVYDLCSGKERWVMRVPAQPDRDSDLIIMAGLDAVETILSQIEANVRSSVSA